ncbi:MAG: tRNA pseudouridine(38-40) synthase TruA [Clostridiales bacterium GWF2_36_10]|nr:MAG: tRNA pseudouridine(38-40) synthase TruA [Clostridiales bacterium GWF2_36_10]
MVNYALTLKFNGSAYCGWQVQKNALSVQEVLQNAVEYVFKKRLGITGCSRTDSGVHANEYVCHIQAAPEFDLARLPLAINSHLPKDIAVLSAKTIDDTFHARYDANGKEYVYKIWNSRIHNPFFTDTAFHYPKIIDIEKASKITGEFVGKHDFASFMASHSKIEDTVREIWYFKAEREGDFVNFIVAADGFLYNMVRIMCGTILHCLRGHITLPISAIIEAKDRNLAGATLPPHGLYLNRIFY